MWKKRIFKFFDNPLVIIGFLKRHLLYRFIADQVSQTYADVHFLNGKDTLAEIIKNNRSIIRAGDGTFGYLSGSSIYFHDWQFIYSYEFAQELRKVLHSSQNKDILYCYPHRFALMSKRQFAADGIGNEWIIWITTKVLLAKFLHKHVIYGDALCFHPRYNSYIDFQALDKYLSNKHVIIITSNTKRFAGTTLGKTTNFIEAPSSDVWQSYRELEEAALTLVADKNWSKSEVLFMISAAEAAKVMVFNLANKGYIAWDTGQFFDLATKEIANTDTN